MGGAEPKWGGVCRKMASFLFSFRVNLRSPFAILVLADKNKVKKKNKKKRWGFTFFEFSSCTATGGFLFLARGLATDMSSSFVLFCVCVCVFCFCVSVPTRYANRSPTERHELERARALIMQTGCKSARADVGKEGGAGGGVGMTSRTHLHTKVIDTEFFDKKNERTR